MDMLATDIADYLVRKGVSAAWPRDAPRLFLIHPLQSAYPGHFTHRDLCCIFTPVCFGHLRAFPQSILTLPGLLSPR
jgi:hypothetical protein